MHLWSAGINIRPFILIFKKKFISAIFFIFFSEMKSAEIANLIAFSWLAQVERIGFLKGHLNNSPLVFLQLSL